MIDIWLIILEFLLEYLKNETRDKGRNIVRIDPEIMHILNISDGDLISVIGPQNGTNIVCLSILLIQVMIKRLIRIDTKARDLIGATLGDIVTIKKAILSEKITNPQGWIPLKSPRI